MIDHRSKRTCCAVFFALSFLVQANAVGSENIGVFTSLAQTAKLHFPSSGGEGKGNDPEATPPIFNNGKTIPGGM